MADIFPGARVVEAGVGSGALTHVAAARHRRRRPAASRSSAARTSPTSPAGTPSLLRRRRTRPGGSSSAISWRRSPRRSRPAPSTASSSTCSRPGSAWTPWPTPSLPGGVLICYVATTTQLSRVAEGIREPRRLHRAAAPGSPWSGAGTSRGWRSGPSTGCTGIPASSSPPDGWRPESLRRSGRAGPRRGPRAAGRRRGGQRDAADLGERPVSEKKVRRVRRTVTQTSEP